jgi:hypothetical protein
MSSAPAPPEETVPALNEGQRLLYTFIEPSKTMADIRRNASWWVPWLLVSIVSVAFAFTLDKKIGWGQAIETQIQANPKTSEKIEKMPAEQREKMLKMQEGFASALGYATPVTTLVVLVVIAGVLLGVFNFGFGTKMRFGELLAVSAYSLLPSIIYTLLIIVIMFFVEGEVFDVKNPVASNVGYFFPATMPYLKALLGVFDVFTLWQVLLLSVGISQLSKVKQRTAFATIFGLLFLIKLAAAGFSSM